MKHKTASSFWTCYERLPIDIRNLADKNFQLLKDNSAHPSLQFKKVGKVWSARIAPHRLKAGSFGCGLEPIQNMTDYFRNIDILSDL